MHQEYFSLLQTTCSAFGEDPASIECESFEFQSLEIPLSCGFACTEFRFWTWGLDRGAHLRPTHAANLGQHLFRFSAFRRYLHNAPVQPALKNFVSAATVFKCCGDLVQATSEQELRLPDPSPRVQQPSSFFDSYRNSCNKRNSQINKELQLLWKWREAGCC